MSSLEILYSSLEPPIGQGLTFSQETKCTALWEGWTRLWHTLYFCWTGYGQTLYLDRPWTDPGQTLDRDWTKFGFRVQWLSKVCLTTRWSGAPSMVGVLSVRRQPRTAKTTPDSPNSYGNRMYWCGQNSSGTVGARREEKKQAMAGQTREGKRKTESQRSLSSALRGGIYTVSVDSLPHRK